MMTRTDMDIRTAADVRLLVNQFYHRVRKDPLLAPVFNAVIEPAHWPLHLDTMCRFWETILLHNRGYLGDPLVKHRPLPLTREHFDRWLTLFETTVNKLFIGEVAEEAKRRAHIIARLIMHGNSITKS